MGTGGRWGASVPSARANVNARCYLAPSLITARKGTGGGEAVKKGEGDEEEEGGGRQRRRIGAKEGEGKGIGIGRGKGRRERSARRGREKEEGARHQGRLQHGRSRLACQP